MEYEVTGLHDGGTLRAILVIRCARRCQIPIRAGEARAWPGGHVWGWDGNSERPTVTPSVSCGKCGFHKTLIKGEWQ